uniref:NAC domain-containing protein n=1 Tax=Salix viminalis TaxID=40686 RepID=A0A6N2LFW7_SALVM
MSISTVLRCVCIPITPLPRQRQQVPPRGCRTGNQFYLYKKITDPDHFTPINVPVRDCPLFGDQAREPWQIWDTFPKRHGENLFFFTQLDKKGQKFARKICGGPGTWHQVYKNPPFTVSIDHTFQVAAIKKLFTYKNPKSDQNGSWIMFEYSLLILSEQTFLCQLIRNEAHASEKVQATTTTTTTRKRKRIARRDGRQKRTMFQKPRVEKDAQKQQIMGFNGDSKTVSQEKNQQLHLELEPVFDNGVQSDNFESFYFEPSTLLENYLMGADSDITSTSNPAPPTVFTLDHAENLQPSDIDGDAAATENDDFHSEIFGLLDLSGYCDEEAGVPSTLETAEASAYWAQATNHSGSTLHC